MFRIDTADVYRYRKDAHAMVTQPSLDFDNNHQVVMWDKHWKGIPWWESRGKNLKYNHGWEAWTTPFKTIRDTVSSKSGSLVRHQRMAWLSVKCDWCAAQISDANMHWEDMHVAYTVVAGLPTSSKGARLEVGHLRAIEEAFKVRDWLLTNPVVDGLHLSQHRWNVCAEAYRAKRNKAIGDEAARVLDPPLTPSQVKQLLEAIKAERHYDFRWIGRGGTRAAGQEWCVELDRQNFYTRHYRRPRERAVWSEGLGCARRSTFAEVKRYTGEYISTTAPENITELKKLGVIK